MDAFHDLVEELRGIYRELRRLIDAEGHGAISRIQSVAGVGESYLRDLWPRLAAGRDKGYDLGVLLRLLRALGVDRRIFFGRVYGAPDPVALLELETRQLGEPEDAVVRLRDLLLEGGWEPPAELPAEIRSLDKHRHTDARAVREAAHGDLVKVASGLLPRSSGVALLAVYGSALRMLMQLDEAQQALMAGLAVARRHGDPSTIADLLQRLSYVVGDRGNYQHALELSRVAESWHVRADDRVGIGKTLADQGGWLHYLGRFRDSIALNEVVLRYLPAELGYNRFGALQVSGLGCLALGDADEAQRYAELAEEQAAGVGPWQRMQLKWLQARIAASKRAYDTAEELFRRTTEYFAPLCPVSAALASAELVRVLMLQSRLEESYGLARSILRFVEPLRDNKLASAAMADLWRCANARRGLDLKLVERTIRELEKGRVPRCTRPLGCASR
jgi:tetratricopeptide (TPR) repeat protein